MKIIQFIQNPAVIAGLSGAVIAVIDLAMALNPNLKGNGLLHSVMVFLKKQNPPAGS